jgi:hypothetical protein
MRLFQPERTLEYRSREDQAIFCPGADRSGRAADVAVCQASFVAAITIFNLTIRTGPEFDDALADALFFVGYDISIFHDDAPLVQDPRIDRFKYTGSWFETIR